MYSLMKVIVVPPRSVSTARTSALSSSGSSYVTIRHPIGDGVVDKSNKSSTATSCRVITPDSGIACELLTSTWWQCKKSSSSAQQCKMPLQLNCRNLPLSKVGPGVAVLIWAGELGPMERYRWRGTAGRGSPRTRGSNEFVPSRRTPAPWWALLVKLWCSIWGSSMGPAAGSLLGSGFWSSSGGTTSRTPCIGKRPKFQPKWTRSPHTEHGSWTEPGWGSISVRIRRLKRWGRRVTES